MSGHDFAGRPFSFTSGSRLDFVPGGVSADHGNYDEGQPAPPQVSYTSFQQLTSIPEAPNSNTGNMAYTSTSRLDFVPEPEATNGHGNTSNTSYTSSSRLDFVPEPEERNGAKPKNSTGRKHKRARAVCVDSDEEPSDDFFHQTDSSGSESDDEDDTMDMTGTVGMLDFLRGLP